MRVHRRGGVEGAVGVDPGAADSAAVTRFLDDLRGLGDGPVPAPSAELAALLAGVPTLGAARRRRPHIVRRVVLIAAAVVAGTTLAAANDRLPAPAQRVVSNIVNDLTPFHIGPPLRAATPTTPAPTTPVRTSPPPTHVAPVPVSSSEDRPEPSDPRSSIEPGDDRGGAGESSGTTRSGGDDRVGESTSAGPTRSFDGGESGGGSDAVGPYVGSGGGD